MKREVVIMNAIDLMKDAPSEKDCIAGDLEAAARFLRKPNFRNRLGSIAWRVADSGLRIRELIRRLDEKSLIGFDLPTGRGVVLPVLQPHPERFPTAVAFEKFGKLVDEMKHDDDEARRMLDSGDVDDDQKNAACEAIAFAEQKRNELRLVVSNAIDQLVEIHQLHIKMKEIRRSKLQ